MSAGRQYYQMSYINSRGERQMMGHPFACEGRELAHKLLGHGVTCTLLQPSEAEEMLRLWGGEIYRRVVAHYHTGVEL